MKRATILLGPLVAVLAACGTSEETPKEPRNTEPQSTVAPAIPPEPQPATDAACPYLAEDFVAETNGQRVARVAISADTPNPACFFYRADDAVQLTVRVYTGDAATAEALVNQAAPIDTSNPAELTGGWTGGYLTIDGSGAVYAVSKEATAVVVTTNQQQTIKARRVVEQTITALAL